MQLQPIGNFVLAQKNKQKNSTTKQSSFASRSFTFWLSVGIFENGYNYSFSRVKTICQSCFADTLFTGHQACTFMHPKYRIPSVAINAHQLCSSTYHLRKLFLQMKTYFTSFYSHNTEQPFSDSSPRISLTAMIPPRDGRQTISLPETF